MAIGRKYHATLKIRLVPGVGPDGLREHLSGADFTVVYGPAATSQFGRMFAEIGAGLEAQPDYRGRPDTQKETIGEMVAGGEPEPGWCWLEIGGEFSDDQFRETDRYLKRAVSLAADEIREYPVVEEVVVTSSRKTYKI